MAGDAVCCPMGCRGIQILLSDIRGAVSPPPAPGISSISANRRRRDRASSARKSDCQSLLRGPCLETDSTACRARLRPPHNACSGSYALRHAATSCSHPGPDGSQRPLRGPCLETYWTAWPAWPGPHHKACSGGHVLRHRIGDLVVRRMVARNARSGGPALRQSTWPSIIAAAAAPNARSRGHALRSADVAVREAELSAVFQHKIKCIRTAFGQMPKIALYFPLQLREFIGASRGWGRRCGPAHQLRRGDARPPILRPLARALAIIDRTAGSPSGQRLQAHNLAFVGSTPTPATALTLSFLAGGSAGNKGQRLGGAPRGPEWSARPHCGKSLSALRPAAAAGGSESSWS